MPTPVSFNEELHEYRTLSGRVLPGITSILRAAGLMWEVEGIPWIDKEKGTRVHRAIHFDCEGDLDESTVSSQDMIYVEGARLAREELGLKIIHAEYAVGNEPCGYATKVDLLAMWKEELACANWKTSATTYHFERIQLALEALCFSPETPHRLGIHLRGDKPGYRVQRYLDRSDFVVAKAALTVAHWRHIHEKRSKDESRSTQSP